MKSFVSTILLSTILLSSCGSAVVAPIVPAKTPLVIDTYTVGKTQTGVSIEKTGRITASSSLTLSAQ